MSRRPKSNLGTTNLPESSNISRDVSWNASIYMDNSIESCKQWRRKVDSPKSGGGFQIKLLGGKIVSKSMTVRRLTVLAHNQKSRIRLDLRSRGLPYRADFRPNE